MKSCLSTFVIFLAILVTGRVLTYLNVPTNPPPRSDTVATDCINNLRQLDGATKQWMLENQKSKNAIPMPEDLKPYVKLTSSGQIPQCLDGGTYTRGRVADPVR